MKVKKMYYFYSGKPGYCLNVAMTLHDFIKNGTYIRPKFIMHLFWLTLLLASLALFSEDILAQTEAKDTVSIIEDLTKPKDSLVYNPGRFSGKWNSLSDSLFLKTSPNRLNRELNSLLQKFYQSQAKSKKKIPVTNANLTAYDGLIIRNIEFKSLNVYSGSIVDTGFVPTAWNEKIVTAIHFNTTGKNHQ